MEAEGPRGTREVRNIQPLELRFCATLDGKPELALVYRLRACRHRSRSMRCWRGRLQPARASSAPGTLRVDPRSPRPLGGPGMERPGHEHTPVNTACPASVGASFCRAWPVSMASVCRSPPRGRVARRGPLTATGPARAGSRWDAPRREDSDFGLSKPRVGTRRYGVKRAPANS